MWQRTNEDFYRLLQTSLPNSALGTCALALTETAMPFIKETKSTLMGTTLRLGDTEVRGEEALEIWIKTSKCTAISRPKGWKKFGKREEKEKMEGMDVDEEEGGRKAQYAQLKMQTEYYLDRSNDDDEEKDRNEEDDVEMDDGEEATKSSDAQKVEKEDLVRGFKYGTTYAPCPDGQFPRLNTKKGIDICGFFPAKNVCSSFSLFPV